MSGAEPSCEVKTHGIDHALIVQWGCGVAILTGLLVLIVGATAFVKAVPTQQWVSARGTVLYSGVAVRTDLRTEQTDDPGGTTVSASGIATCIANVVYEYSFQGKNYTGNRVDITSTDLLQKKEADRKISPYSPGMAVRVFVNPGIPEESVLEREETGIAFVSIVTGLVLAMFGVWGRTTPVRSATSGRA